MPFVAWYLAAGLRESARRLARIVVDYIDLHYYPQGQNVALSDDDSPATSARRLRSLKELYDPTWVSESWISDLGDTDANHYDKPDLIPRVRAWIDQYCPGTKLAITEYNWGNDGTSSGAVAQAEVLRHLRARRRRPCDALGRAGREHAGRARVHAVPQLRRRGVESFGRQRVGRERERRSARRVCVHTAAGARWCC